MHGYVAWLVLAVFAGTLKVNAQTCLAAADMEASLRNVIEAAARRYFDLSQKDEVATLRLSSIPELASNFNGVENVIKENQAQFKGATAVIRPPFLLTVEGSEPLARGEFLCGVFGKSGQTAESAVFILNNLPPGKYAVAILDVSGGSEPRAVTVVLQQIGTEWKLAGYYARPTEAAGHDGAWFAQRARDYKAKSQNHNSWLYYREAIALSAPVDFMSTLTTDRLYDEAAAVQPSDMPSGGNRVDLNVVGKNYPWAEVFPLAVGNDIDVVVRYSAADISNTQKTFQENLLVIKAVVTKFPELRDAFGGVVARAVDPSGHDYGTMLPMKEIK